MSPPDRDPALVTALRVLFGVAAAVCVLYMLAPAFSGYHLGCDALIDHYRLVRVGLEWCR